MFVTLWLYIVYATVQYADLASSLPMYGSILFPIVVRHDIHDLCLSAF